MSRVTESVKVLNEGGIIIFPSDTTFVIGCKMDKKDAVARLFNTRKRPKSQAVSVLVDSVRMAQEYLQPLDRKVKELMRKYWPGALTVVYKCKTAKVNPLIRGNGKTLGVRMPNYTTVLELIKGVGVPILGPSANFHGENTPYSFEDLNPDLIKLVDHVIPGRTKNFSIASTVIDCSLNPWKIIRQGAVTVDL